MQKTNINSKLYEYAIKYSLKEPLILTKLRLETSKLADSIKQITPEQGQFMGLIAKLIKAKKYLEIGVFTGYSLLSVALNLGSDSKIVAIDNNKETLEIAKKYLNDANILNKVELINEKALSALPKLLAKYKNYFDIAFIDANKSDYIKYYNYCYELIRVGGAILIDNTLFHGEVINDNSNKIANAIKEFNNYIFNDRRVIISLIPFADGLTLAYKL